MEVAPAASHAERVVTPENSVCHPVERASRPVPCTHRYGMGTADLHAL